ncbi:EAL domain-containing protein [Klebsiella variicola subsp. variicola]|nr:EAL domain-containing protein [Klebsiella variicola subsp. variicola]
MPQFRADYAWLLLTAFVLREAVQNNEHPGTFYFRSIFLPRSPPAIACCGWWKPLASSSGSQGAWKGWCWNMPKPSIFSVRARSTARVEELQRAGVRVMLDDCFSRRASSFRRVACTSMPINWIWYRQRRSARSEGACADKSTAYYCQLSGSRCVAEGVDSLAKFTQLKSLGIDRFQGYLFSPPMRRRHLPDLIRRFSHQRDPADR